MMQSWIFSIITPVFSVTWSFRNHSNMLILCSRNISLEIIALLTFLCRLSIFIYYFFLLLINLMRPCGIKDLTGPKPLSSSTHFCSTMHTILISVEKKCLFEIALVSVTGLDALNSKTISDISCISGSIAVCTKIVASLCWYITETVSNLVFCSCSWCCSSVWQCHSCLF